MKTILLSCLDNKVGRFSILAFITLFAYYFAFGAPFLWDDEVMVEGNMLIRSWSNVGTIFTSSAFGDPLESGKFFRPIQILSYVFDYSIWGLNPFGFHLTSVAIHLLTVFSIYGLGLAFFLSPRHSFFLAFLFAVHPVHIESVTYISGRGDVMFLLFCVWSMIAFLKATRLKPEWHIVSVFFFGIAIMTKETAISLPLVLLAYALIVMRGWGPNKGRIDRWTWLSLGVHLSIMMGYILTRLDVFRPASGLATYSPISLASVSERLLTLPYIIWTYVRLIFAPFPLHMEYHEVVRSPLHASVWLGLPIALIVLFLLYRYSRMSRLSLFFLFWFFISLGPFYNVILPLASTVREHWLSFSSIPIMILMVAATMQGYRQLTGWKQRVLATIAILFLFTLTGLTFARNYDWTDDLRLYEHDVRYEPRSFLLHNNIGVIYFRQQNLRKAKAAFQASIDVSPAKGYGVAHNNLGVLYEQEGQLEKALSLYQLSIYQSNYYLAYTNLARNFLQQERYAEAYQLLNKGLRYHPYRAELLYLSFVSFWMHGERERAISIYNALLRLAPDTKFAQHAKSFYARQQQLLQE